MPGLNGTGPMGMGPRTGGARGLCNADAKPFSGRGFSSWSFQGRGKGRRRGNRPMSGFTEIDGWTGRGQKRYGNRPFPTTNSKEQEIEFLRDQSKNLKEELKDIDSLILEIESD